MILRRFLSIIVLLLPLLAFAEDFVAGKDYELISSTAETNESKVLVTEFFSYGCPWCYRIEPALMNWVKQKGDDIQFSRVPVVFNNDWFFYAKAYYTAHLLGQETKLNTLLFKAALDKTQTMNNNQAMIDFFTAQGVDSATAKSAFENSTTITMKVTEGTALMARYHVNGVPAIVINNQYKTDLKMARDEARLLKVLDFLIAKSEQKPTKAH